MMYKEIDKCRVSGSKNLIAVVNLGEQYLTGVFPKKTDTKISRGPLELVWCPDSYLLQMKQSYSSDEMYGENYGYRSGRNQSMVNHLEKKAKYLENLCELSDGDYVVDIGSNDATTLKAFKTTGINRIGIDPVGKKHEEYYDDGIRLIPEFFPSETFETDYGKNKVSLITSISMFYDLEDPKSFIQSIKSNLNKDGIWHFEQSYMPSMLRTNAYDTICHEHIEYYSLKPVKRLLDQIGLKIIDIQVNDINGGSFAVTATHNSSKKYSENKAIIEWMLLQEDRMGLNTPKPFRDFEERIFRHKDDLWELINRLLGDDKKIIGYGASTTGNVLLQFCGLTSNEILYIAEINEDKFGSFTPGTNIPIISETEAREMNPDYFFVLPWHFKNNIISRETDFIKGGGKFIFPLPYIEIV